MRNKARNEKGITLIALIITIIVILILIGISLSMISDKNGILKKAELARNNYIKGKEDEEAIIDGLTRQINYYTGDDSVFDELTFDFATTDWHITYTTSVKGKLTIIPSKEDNLKWFYKIGNDGEYTEITDKVDIEDWSYSANYMTGEVNDSILNIGYQLSNSTSINVKKYGFWETLNVKGYNTPTIEPHLSGDSKDIALDKFMADYTIDFDYREPSEEVKGVFVKGLYGKRLLGKSLFRR